MSYKYIKNELKSYTQFKKELKFLNDELEMLKKENSNVKSYCPGKRCKYQKQKTLLLKWYWIIWKKKRF